MALQLPRSRPRHQLPPSVALHHGAADAADVAGAVARSAPQGQGTATAAGPPEIVILRLKKTA